MNVAKNAVTNAVTNAVKNAVKNVVKNVVKNAVTNAVSRLAAVYFAMLPPEDASRYARQIVLPELGLQGQQRLREARVLVVGAGGLGSPALLYLAAAGVGTIGIIDDDNVETSNLHRQVLHGNRDVGRPKVDSAADAIARLNPDVVVERHQERLTRSNASSIVRRYDIVVDGSDNFATRYAVNDACAELGTTWVYGSVERYSGQVAVFGAPDGPCYRCIFPDAPAPGSTPSCEEIGVLGAVPGVIGAMQALESIKLISGAGEPLVGRMLQMDLLTGQVRTVRFDKRPDCVACGEGADGETKARGAEAVQELAFDIQPLEAQQSVRENLVAMLLDIREPWECARAGIEGATLVPMRELQAKASSLDRSRELIVFCHHGGRSKVATEWLRSQGFRARNLAGGIDRWSREIDPTVPRY